jgi:hypothetical protein
MDSGGCRRDAVTAWQYAAFNHDILHHTVTDGRPARALSVGVASHRHCDRVLVTVTVTQPGLARAVTVTSH